MGLWEDITEGAQEVVQGYGEGVTGQWDRSRTSFVNAFGSRAGNILDGGMDLTEAVGALGRGDFKRAGNEAMSAFGNALDLVNLGQKKKGPKAFSNPQQPMQQDGNLAALRDQRQRLIRGMGYGTGGAFGIGGYGGGLLETSSGYNDANPPASRIILGGV